MKRYFWVVCFAVLAVCLLFILPTEAHAAEIVDSGTCGENLTWTLDDAGVLTISGTGAMTDFAMRRPIPDVIPPWYANCTAIQQVIIESGTTSIGSQAFEDCTNLSAVSIPNTVQTIGVYAFKGCSNLRSVCIPEGVVSIDTGAFLGCEMFLWIELPQSLQTIGASAFQNPGTNYRSRHIVYGGSKSQWDQIEIGYDNTILTSDIGATRHYNSSARLTQKETCSLLCWKCSSCGSFAALKKPTHNHEFKDGVCGTCGVDENWQYNLTSDGKINIYGYLGDEPYLIVPSSIEGYPVTSLRLDDYPYDDTLLAIFIPSSVKEIYMPGEIWAGGIVKRFPNLNHVLYGGSRYAWDDAVTSMVNSVTRYHFGCSSNKVSYVETCETILLDCTDCGCFLTQKKTTNDHVFTEGTCTKCGTEEGWEYTVTTYRNVVITGYAGTKTEVTVPTQIEGMPVIAIENRAFQDNVNLEAITIASGVTRIGKSAFAGCSGLKHVSIPSSLIMAQESAFSGCVALEDVHIEDLSAWCNIDFNNFASNPLFYADMLYVAGQQTTNLVIPEDVDTIAAYTFYGYDSMTAVNISSSVTNIGTSAFSSCGGLTTITIPDSVTSIGDGAFAGCINLERIYIGKNVKNIGSRAFVNCEKLAEISIPDCVTTVGASAFEGCSGLTTVTLGYGIQTIGSNAFDICDNLETINLQSIEAWQLINIENYLADPMQVGAERKKLQVKGEPITDLIIPEGVRTIRSGAFRNCAEIQSIHFPDTIENIDSRAFSGCAGLKEVHWGSNRVTVGSYAFDKCSALEGVYIKDVAAWCACEFNSNPLSKAGNLYLNGKQVTNLVIPEGVTTVGSRCFQGCNSLESLTLPDSLRSVDSSAFSNCKNLKTIHFGSSVKILASYAFGGCSALENIVLPDSLQTLYSYAFASCSGLQSVELSNSLTTLGEKVFYGCESLWEITIPGGVSTIGDSAFEDCTALRNVVIKSGVKYINPSAFHGCENVRTVVIPDTVKYIGQWAFYPSLRMEHVFYLGTQSQWNNINIESLGNGPLSVGQMHYVTETNCDHSYYRCQDCDETYNFYGTVIPEYTITFLNWDGSIIAQYFFHDGDIVPSPMTPEKGTDSTCTYSFMGWDHPVEDVCVGDATYTAIFEKTCVDYTVTFLDFDGRVISSQTYHYGDPVDIPTDPDRKADNTYTYSFKNWGTTASETCTGNAEYTATYDAEYIEYTVEFRNWDGTVISRTNYHYGDAVLAPTNVGRSADKVYSYRFAGWDNDVTACQGNVVYTAVYQESLVNYTVTFQNYDGSVISSNTYHYGDTVEIPVVTVTPSDKVYNYYFIGWDSDVTTCQGNTTYTAAYSTEYIEYTVAFRNWDGSVISSATYHYGETIEVPAAPQKPADQTHTYAFVGWSADVTVCEGDATYTAMFTPSNVQYTVVFKNYDGSIISSKVYHYGDTVTAPADPTKVADNTYRYTFTGWDKKVVACAGDVTYTATYDSTYIDYTVTFKNYNGTVISSKTYHYGDTVTVPVNPFRAADNTYTYTFKDWGKSVAATCAGNVEYTAVYTTKFVDYTVVFKNWDGSVISTKTYHYGDVITVPANPTKAADNTYAYAFKCWDKAVTNCAGNATYTATYTSTYINYTVVFKDWNGKILSTETYHWSDKVTAPADPTKVADNTYTYAFAGWDKAVVSCAGDATYTATYTSAYINYTIVFKNWNGTVLSTRAYHFGDIVTVPANPSRPGDDSYSYTFTGWDKTVVACNGDTTYTAVYSSQTRVPSAITSSTYTVSGTKISKISTGTTVATLVGKLNEGQYVKVYNGIQEVSGSTLIGTGMVIKIMDGNTAKATYTIVVTGDTNGDGKITVTDMLAVKAHVLKKSTLTGASAQAADTSGDNAISITDFIQMKAQILGKSNVEPRAVNASAQQLSTASVEPEASVTTVTTEYTTNAADKTVSTLNYTQVVAVIPDKKSLVAL